MQRYRIKHLHKTYRCVNCGKNTTLAFGGTSYCRSCISKHHRRRTQKNLLQSKWLRKYSR